MPKVGMQPIRRRQLIEATIASIHEHGFADATVSRISRAAGVSAGIVHHYFGGKNELLEASMRSLLSDLREATRRRLLRARSARARVRAIIDANFAPEQFAPQAVTAWLAFWAQVPHTPRLARLQHINDRRLRSNLRHALKQLTTPLEAERITDGLAAMIDGLWLQCALTSGALEPAAARDIARDYFEKRLPRRRRRG